jgi:hypothetical protein
VIVDSWHGKAWHGKAGLGSARPGEAWFGKELTAAPSRDGEIETSRRKS